jgi:hypothetical protein
MAGRDQTVALMKKIYEADRLSSSEAGAPPSLTFSTLRR